MLKKFLVAGCLILGLSAAGATVANAATFVSGENANFSSDKTSDGTLYIAGSTVTVAGSVDGDLFCAGQTVEVSGKVNGDVICAAQQVRITGTISGDIRVAGQLVEIEGSSAGSLTAFAQTLRLADGMSVGRDATLSGQTVTIGGTIQRDLVASGQTVTVNGKVADANIDAQTVNLGSSAVVGGNLTYTSSADANIQSGAVVTGATQHNFPADQPKAQDKASLFGAKIAFAAYWFVSMLFTGLVFLFAFPRLLDASAERTATQPWPVLGWGLVAVFLTPILLVPLAITVIGLPLMFLVLLVWLALLLVSSIFSGHALGRLIINMGGTKMTGGWLRFASLSLGLFVLAVLSLIPFISILSTLLAVAFGTGSLLHLLRKKPATHNASTAKGS